MMTHAHVRTTCLSLWLLIFGAACDDASPADEDVVAAVFDTAVFDAEPDTTPEFDTEVASGDDVGAETDSGVDADIEAPGCPEGDACDDGDACTVADTCRAGTCLGTARTCDDGNACNGVETCDTAMGCIAGEAVDCSDLDGACAEGICDRATGECSARILPDDSACDDGDSCTTDDRCSSGFCAAGIPKTCPAPGVCAVANVCNPAGGLCETVLAEDGVVCDDGRPCTVEDRCDAGVCGGAARLCDDGRTCSTDSCDDGAGGCTSDTSACNCLEDGDCDDGNACNGAETCGDDGRCQGGVARSCSDLDGACVVGVCDPANGACTAVPRPDGGTCDDGAACTDDDRCTGGVCAGVARVCGAIDACHVAGVCDPGTGACTTPAKPDGAICDDGFRCTSNDRCGAGVCGGDAVVCVASGACRGAGTCDPATGQCSNPIGNEGGTCDDGSLCTRNDRCVSGTCAGADPVACTAAGMCRAVGVCDPQSGVCSDPAAIDGSSCSDSNACTDGDRCQSGQCRAGTPRTCASNDTCLVDGQCDAATGVCSFRARDDGSNCNDSNACTTGDRCVSGRCTPASQVTCVAQSQCHQVGTCNTTTGVCSNPTRNNGSACDPGGCASGTCQSGLCQAGASRCYPGETCVSGSCACDQTAVSFSGDVQPIFEAACGPGCHISTNPSGGSGGLNLAAAFAHADMVGVDAAGCSGTSARKRVLVNTPSESYLMHKIRGIRMCSGGIMPPASSTALSATQQAIIGRWICQGAEND